MSAARKAAAGAVTRDALSIAMLSIHSCPLGKAGSQDTGGMNVYLRELAVELGKQGHLIDLYTRAHDPGEPMVADLGEGARLIHITAGEAAGLPKLELYPLLGQWADGLERFRAGEGRRYDLLFSHYWLSACAGRLLQRRWPLPHVVMFHTLGALKNITGAKEPELRLISERELAGCCDKIIVASRREKELLCSYLAAPPEKVSVVPCGVDLELFRPLEKAAAKTRLGYSGEKLFLWVGRIEQVKGLERLLRAFSLLNPSQKRFRLLLAGGDRHSAAEISRLQKLAGELGVLDKITFLGLVEHSELPCYYSAAGLTVVTSYYESFGLVALESLACGTPVAAYDVGAIGELILPGETGVLVKEGSPAALARQIELFINSEPSKTGQQLCASVSRFAWPLVARQLAGELRKLLPLKQDL